MSSRRRICLDCSGLNKGKPFYVNLMCRFASTCKNMNCECLCRSEWSDLIIDNNINADGYESFKETFDKINIDAITIQRWWRSTFSAGRTRFGEGLKAKPVKLQNLHQPCICLNCFGLNEGNPDCDPMCWDDFICENKKCECLCRSEWFDLITDININANGYEMFKETFDKINNDAITIQRWWRSTVSVGRTRFGEGL